MTGGELLLLSLGLWLLLGAVTSFSRTERLALALLFVVVLRVVLGP